MEPVLIIGAGLAAASTAAEYRALGGQEPVVVVGSEPHLPYERPPLSKEFLAGGKEQADFTVHDAGWYQQHGIELRLGTTATHLDRAAQRVQLSDGSTLGYSQLVLATGAVPRTLDANQLPDDTSRIHVLRTIDDARALREAAGPGRTVAVAGAGWIGLEAAATLRSAGADVQLFCPGPLPLPALGARFGQDLLQLHRQHGVQVQLNARVESISAQSDGKLVVHAGELQGEPADLVLLALGAAPATDLAAAAGLELDGHGGIITDAALRTSDARILAVGDAASAFNTTLRRQLRVEHWDNAIRQGKLAAATLCGQEQEYDWLPYFFSDQFELGMEYVGHSDPQDQVVRRELDEGHLDFWLHDSVVSAAMNVNAWDVNDALRALVGRKLDPERLSDPHVPLEQLGQN